ncbi:MAG: NADH-dependent [FeFe] hydrogenase, group A6 [Candidatus Marinimicrobia bacterium]|nr:NADH-dependent [FeFe] hydrogenase, group A6 [Candidatus Neomarinimicrobiota bacterium]
MSEKMINLVIDGKKAAVPEGTTLLEAAKIQNVKIPTLCHHEDLCIAGNCRVCVVEVDGWRVLPAACATPAMNRMKVYTNSPQVRRARKDVLALLVSEHSNQCTTCYRSTNCELQDLAAEYNIDNEIYINLLKKEDFVIDRSSWAIEKDNSKCIRCQRCVRTCTELQKVNALDVINKGADMKVTTFFDNPMNEVVCTTCGQCINRCPTGALTERRYIDEIWEAIGDPEKHVVVQTAPAVRVALGEMLGYEPGVRVTGKMVSALKHLGFDSVLDTDFAADLTIMEEAHELLDRLKRKLVDGEDIPIPMMTSCSPGWIKFIEHMYPDYLAHVSSCKSPQQMFGALAKTYYAERIGVDPKNIVSVSVMPCSAKKYEANRREMNDSGYQDIDLVCTTRELGHMIRQSGINFKEIKNSKFDKFMGESTGAGVIFGATGGVMEAALRTAYEVVTGREVPFDGLNIMPIRGLEGVREAKVKLENVLPEYSFLEGIELRVAIAHGLTNAFQVMEEIVIGDSPYHFIEIMACPSGCIGGGGQPIPTNEEIRKKRAEAIYTEDEKMQIRKSHENPEVIRLYKEFLGKPLGEVSHRLLHTKYTRRERA